MRGRDVGAAIGVLVAVWAAFAFLVSVLVGDANPAVRPMIAVFAPGGAGDAALGRIAASGALPLRPVVGGLVWLVRASEDQADQLRAGAWAVFPPPPLGIVAAGCAGLGVRPDRPLPQGMGR